MTLSGLLTVPGFHFYIGFWTKQLLMLISLLLLERLSQMTIQAT